VLVQDCVVSREVMEVAEKSEMQSEQVADVLAKVKVTLGEPLTYRVASAWVVMRDAPSEQGVELGRLECGSLVQGFPAGKWLFLERSEAEDWLVGNVQVPGGAWLHLDDGESAHGNVLVPQWATASITGLEVAWPGLPQAAAASYIFEWRVQGTDKVLKKQGRMNVGRSSCTQLPHEVTDVQGLQVRVDTCLPNGLRLSSPWGKPQLLVQKVRKSHAKKQAADMVGKFIMVHVDKTAADRFDGCWVTEDDEPVATIKNGMLSMANGPSTKIENESKDGFSVNFDGQGNGLRAHFTAAGKLMWSDGDVWKRSGENAEGAEVTQRIGAGGGGASYKGHDSWRGDGKIYFMPGKKYGGRREFGKDDMDQPGDGSLMLHSAMTRTQDSYDEFDICQASHTQLSECWANAWGALAPEAPEEVPRIRMLYNPSTRVVLLELFSLATTNMMDPEMCIDIRTAVDQLKEWTAPRSPHNDRCPVAMIYQGVGPHFCPGGNHHPLLLENSTFQYSHTTANSMSFDSVQELHFPQVVCQHGACVGGGAACSLSSSHRMADTRMSLSFGNLSRGAVPIMMLSHNLPSVVGRPSAVSIYLTDDTISSYTVHTSGWAFGVCNGVPNLKREGLKFAQRFARDPAIKHSIKSQYPHDMDGIAREGEGFILGFKTGALFGNVKEKQKKKEPIEAIEDKKEPNNLKLTVPEAKTVWDMKLLIEETWKIPVEDQVLVADDGKALEDANMIVEGDMKIQLKFTEQAQAKAEWDAWNESTDDYEDYSWGDDYDYDDDDDYDDEE